MKQKIKVVTFNIRRDLAEDGINHFRFRFPRIVAKIKSEQPELIGFQELMPTAYKQMQDALPEYYIVGCARNADYSDEACAIAYRRDVLELISLEVFWLSDTPRVPGSKYAERGYFCRICTAAVLRYKNGGEPFRVYNTHLDSESEIARAKGIRQIYDRIRADQATEKMPVILMGDFNYPPTSGCFKVIDEYPDLELVDLAKDIHFTFHDYYKKDSTDHGYMKKIDYLYVDANTARTAGECKIYDDCCDGVYLSDHYPVWAEIEI